MKTSAIGGRLKNGETILIDGAIGTELDRRGVKVDPHLWCVDAALSDEELLLSVHRDYIDAGADLITTNTYASSPLILHGTVLEDAFETVVDRSVELALEARQQSERADVAVAGSLSHLVPGVLGGHGQAPSADEMAEAFGKLAERLAVAGVDLILLEMMYHPERMELAYQAAHATGLPVWAGFSARRNDQGVLCAFPKDNDISFADLIAGAAHWELEAAGVMHTRSDITANAVAVVGAQFDVPRYAYPDSGGFNPPNWNFTDVITPQTLVTYAMEWQAAGVRGFGGCCGLGFEHIRALNVLKD